MLAGDVDRAELEVTEGGVCSTLVAWQQTKAEITDLVYGKLCPSTDAVPYGGSDRG